MKKAVRFIVMLLIIIGAINWGLIGFFGYNVVAHLFGGMNSMDMMMSMSMGARVVYAIIGLCGLYAIPCLFKMCCCSKCGPNCNCGSCSKHH